MIVKDVLRMCALAGLLIGSSMAAANAVPISGTGPDAPFGSFTGNLNYVAASNIAATLTISLTNTSPVSNGGYITAFVLNNPGNRIASIPIFTSTNPNFGLIALGDNSVNGAPNGQFDFGATTGGSYEGGGSPLGGIGVTASSTFTFNLTGTTLLALTANSFLSELSTGPGIGDGATALAVRFRGFNTGPVDSDKVVVSVPPVGVPEPASMALLGIGLAGLGIIRRRQSRA